LAALIIIMLFSEMFKIFKKKKYFGGFGINNIIFQKMLKISKLTFSQRNFLCVWGKKGITEYSENIPIPKWNIQNK
jgi:hypothetical protein